MSAAAVSTANVSTTTASAAATAIAAVNHRCTAIAAMDDCCAAIAAMNHRSTVMTATTNCSTRMSAAPSVPAVAATPTQTTTKHVAAPIPARPLPSVVVPAILATEPNELGALDHIEAVGRSAKRFGCDDRRRAEAGAHYRYAAAPNVITDLRILSPQGLMSECNAGPDCLFLK